ncbi:TIGR03620 family F420-dependent LLM class oxidoreductase [Gordonia sp. SID5947]|uniref:LLM class F420-dependent oxidoreductase n=1 Tax=Gordonia sp. SID5947 TaxID=2690315 RepID=UPI001368F4F8|nr:LLM class F420-dependent oxidoreductase [Gordonia sp. SID5947]MYR08810.1 TIGR03620 family F420-dependent LLM class oxidoreductase [Gordonia sp. SID5947]
MTTDRSAHIARFGSHGAWGWWGTFSPERARRIEELGYGTIWLGGSPEHLRPVRKVLESTDTITVATGIVNIWNTDAATIADEYVEIDKDFPGRFYLGIGAGHPEATAEYKKPYGAVVEYLDVLDDKGVPVERRLLAALGPKMLKLSAERSLGAHPYLAPPQNSAAARETLGSGVLLAPEHKAVVDTDPAAARAIGRPPVDDPYLHLRNYVANLKRLGWSDDDIADGGSDALIDALVAHGDAASVRAQVDEHLSAGADHVAIQILGDGDPTEPLAEIIGA